MNNSIEIIFTHPKDSSKTLVVDLDPSCTGGRALAGLTDGGPGVAFLDPAPADRPYELVAHRTGTTITPNAKFADVGLVAKDVVDVIQKVKGALPAVICPIVREVPA